MDGVEKDMRTDEFRDAVSGKAGHAEKITINMGPVELGKVDLLVGEGFYANRTDFIRSAIRSQLDKHQVEVQQSITRNAYIVGVLHYDRRLLERLQQKGERVRITVVGMLSISKDVPAELAQAVIESIQVHGVFHASEAVKAALADRIA
jgi:Arc/MetJ-type ribon-helix-helix transcriptional regulator